MVGQLTPNKGESSADFKLRIEQAQRELAAKRTPPAPPEPPAPAPAATKPESVPTPQPDAKTPPAPPAAPPAQPTAEAAKPAAAITPTPPGKPEDKVDPLEWAKKKGLTTPEAIARSLRALETEFHRRNQGSPSPLAPSVPTAPAQEPPRPSDRRVDPIPPYQPRPGVDAPPPPPRYIPPAPLPRHQLQWIADTYQIPIEDAERLAPMVMDIVTAAQRESDRRFTRLERENARNGEMLRLAQDPSFQHPEVQFELHRILEEEPRIFEVEPAPYTYAFQRALVNIARKNLATGIPETPNAPETPPMSSRPPTTLGTDGGASGKTSSGGALTESVFAQLPLEKKRELLTSIGARKVA